MAGREQAVIRAVVAEVLEDEQIEWLDPKPSWIAHAMVTGTSGLTGHLLTSAEWQEGRFDGEPRRSASLLTTTDEDDIRDALSRLAKAVQSHVRGNGMLKTTRGRFGRRSQILVLPTDEGEWRIGKRWSQPPHHWA